MFQNDVPYLIYDYMIYDFNMMYENSNASEFDDNLNDGVPFSYLLMGGGGGGRSSIGFDPHRLRA